LPLWSFCHHSYSPSKATQGTTGKYLATQSLVAAASSPCEVSSAAADATVSQWQMQKLLANN